MRARVEKRSVLGWNKSKDTSFWFENGVHKIYKNSLHYKNTMDMAWLDDYKLEMNKDLLACDIILDSGLEVGLSWKTIYLGEKGHMEEKKKALHVEINAIRNQHNFTVLSNKYGRLGTGFLGGQKM